MSIIILRTLEQGFIFSILSLGVFLCFKVLNTPDLTVDGSFVLGMSVSAVLAYNGHPLLGILCAVVLGACAGSVTALLHTKLGIMSILAGILVMNGLYTVNLHIMGGKPNIPLMDKTTVFDFISGRYGNLILLFLSLLAVLILLHLFLRTQLGLCLIATGDNERMSRASSINVDLMKIIGFSTANALVALSGALFAQYQGFSDISGGVGMMIIGLASIIVGTTLYKKDSRLVALVSVVLGAVVYRFVLVGAMMLGFEQMDLKLLSSVIVVLVLSTGFIKKKWGKKHA